MTFQISLCDRSKIIVKVIVNESSLKEAGGWGERGILNSSSLLKN